MLRPSDGARLTHISACKQNFGTSSSSLNSHSTGHVWKQCQVPPGSAAVLRIRQGVGPTLTSNRHNLCASGSIHVNVQDAGPIVQCVDPEGANTSFQQVGRFLGRSHALAKSSGARFISRSLSAAGLNDQGWSASSPELRCECRPGPGGLHRLRQSGGLACTSTDGLPHCWTHSAA